MTASILKQDPNTQTVKKRTNMTLTIQNVQMFRDTPFSKPQNRQRLNGNKNKNVLVPLQQLECVECLEC